MHLLSSGINQRLMKLFTIESRSWSHQQPAGVQDAAITALESGSVVFLPHLSFELEPPELTFLDPASVHGAKNVSFNPANGKLGGTTAHGDELERLRGLLSRFSRATDALVRSLFPAYAPGLQRGR